MALRAYLSHMKETNEVQFMRLMVLCGIIMVITFVGVIFFAITEIW